MSKESNGSGAPDSATADPLVGTPYRTLSALGRGGMGEVVLAEHRRLGKTLVVKLVHPELVHPYAAERLRVEAQILAKLNHPNIVEVSDLGMTPSGRPYLAMEHLVGRTLQEEVRKRTFLPIAEAVEIGRAVLSALSAAHAAGIVHRDIKAENIFLHMDARAGGARVVKVLDFGVAKVLAADQAVLPSRFPTEEGMILGTPRFCSPEQAIGRTDIDHRADIYSVGTLLFAMVVGRRPFEQRDMLELIQAHLTLPPPTPSTLAKQAIPPRLDQVILKALEKSPARRFQSAEEMSAELQLATAPPPAPPRPTVRVEPLPLPITSAPAVVLRTQTPALPYELAPTPTRAPTPRDPSVDRFRFALLFAIVTMIFGIAVIFTIRAVMLNSR